MKKIVLFSLLGLLFTFLALNTIKEIEVKKLKNEHLTAKSELNQIHKCILTYLCEDENNQVMPAYKDFHVILQGHYYEPWIMQEYSDEVRFHYKPGIKLSEVNPKDKLISFRNIYVRWDGIIEGEFKRPD